jgi:hypothetical protein
VSDALPILGVLSGRRAGGNVKIGQALAYRLSTGPLDTFQRPFSFGATGPSG